MMNMTVKSHAYKSATELYLVTSVLFRPGSDCNGINFIIVIGFFCRISNFHVMRVDKEESYRQMPSIPSIGFTKLARMEIVLQTQQSVIM